MKVWSLLLLWVCWAAGTEDFAGRLESRAAIERVYYNHRIGQKPAFEQASPLSLIERLVKEDLAKEVALRKVYGVEVTAAQVEVEVQRINTTTRAPEMLAEIKAALGNDPARFAGDFARPILVERLLRDKFENDDGLHAAQRQVAERVRERLLAARLGNDTRRADLIAEKTEVRNPRSEAVLSNLVAILKADAVGQVSESTWRLGPRPGVKGSAVDLDEMEIKTRFGSQAQLICAPQREKDQKVYFEDVPPALREVLREQLRQAGDVSAVIETPGGFMLYVAREKTVDTLRIAVLSIPKRNFEEWLTIWFKWVSAGRF